MNLREIIIRRTHRVPVETVTPSESHKTLGAVLCLDVVLAETGFKLSPDLMARLSRANIAELKELGLLIVSTTDQMVGNHRRHNPLFKDFPNTDIPFARWWGFVWGPWVGSSVPTVPHTFDEMMAIQTPLMQTHANRLKVLQVGGTLFEECSRLFMQFAESKSPMNEEDMAIFRVLANAFGDYVLPDTIPLRENRAVINGARLKRGLPLAVTTSTDILRAIVEANGGDVSLATPCKFKNLSRPSRRAIASAFDGREKGFFDGVVQYVETWKRLAKVLHPRELKGEGIRYAFDIAQGVVKHDTLNSHLELAFQAHSLTDIRDHARRNPGVLFRRLADIGSWVGTDEVPYFQEMIREFGKKVEMRTLLATYAALVNRPTSVQPVKPSVSVGWRGYRGFKGHGDPNLPKRMFKTKTGKVWTCDDVRAPLSEPVKSAILTSLLDAIREVAPTYKEILIGKDYNPRIALPITEKNTVRGLMTFPQGTVVPLDSSKPVARLFMYWHEKNRRTDYDLSGAMLAEDFTLIGHCSWTYLDNGTMKHSGDITSAHNGATEFLDIRLAKVPADVKYIVPTVNVFAGETFSEVEEAFFGVMLRDGLGTGAPFEPKTVELKTEVRGDGQCASPIVLRRSDANPNAWEVMFTNVIAEGRVVWDAKFINGLRGALARGYFSTGMLLRIFQSKVDPTAEKSLYVGVSQPEDPKVADVVVTLQNLTDLFVDP